MMIASAKETRQVPFISIGSGVALIVTLILCGSTGCRKAVSYASTVHIPLTYELLGSDGKSVAVIEGDDSLEMIFNKTIFGSHPPGECSIDVNFGTTDPKGIFSTVSPPAGVRQDLKVAPDGNIHLTFKGAAIHFDTIFVNIAENATPGTPFYRGMFVAR